MPQGFYIGVNLLLDEDVKNELKQKKEKEKEEMTEKLRKIKERRLEDKAWNLILKEVKKPNSTSFLKESDKVVLE